MNVSSRLWGEDPEIFWDERFHIESEKERTTLLACVGVICVLALLVIFLCQKAFPTLMSQTR